MADHAALRERETDEHADRVEGDEGMRIAVEDHEESERDPGEQHDAPAVGEAVAAEAELARHETILGEDRCQPGEGVETRVRGEEEDEGGARLEQHEQRTVRAERRSGDDRHHRRPATVVDARHDREGMGDDREADEDDAEDHGH